MSEMRDASNQFSRVSSVQCRLHSCPPYVRRCRAHCNGFGLDLTNDPQLSVPRSREVWLFNASFESQTSGFLLSPCVLVKGKADREKRTRSADGSLRLNITLHYCQRTSASGHGRLRPAGAERSWFGNTIFGWAVGFTSQSERRGPNRLPPAWENGRSAMN